MAVSRKLSSSLPPRKHLHIFMGVFEVEERKIVTDMGRLDYLRKLGNNNDGLCVGNR